MTRIATLVIVALVVIATSGAGPALAQEPAKPPSASQDGFVPVTGPIDQSDTIPAPMLVGIAYAFIWIVLFGYLWSLRTRLGSVEREMAALERRVASGRK
jgi:CcmD family protein